MNINIVSTYTADVLRAELQNYLRKFCDADICFFYNQFFQQTMFPNSKLSTSKQGLNVILFRLSDYFSSQEQDVETHKKQEAITHALHIINKNMSIPLLFIVTPSCTASEQESAFFNTIETALKKCVLEHRHTLYLNLNHPLNTPYSIYNPFTEKYGHIPYTMGFYHSLAVHIARTCSLLSRKPFKVIVVDCDGTLWNGIIEEQGLNGIEIDVHYKEVQQFLIDCYKKGFLLCLCSKNSEASVIDVFKNHPDMLIQTDIHVSTSRINWLTKSQNIKDIAQELNLGLDSFIFIDDNPLECAEVKAAIPELLAIELPKDKAERLLYLQNIWAFDTLDKGRETNSRTTFYQTNRLRNQLKSQSVSYADFLKKLNIKTLIDEVTEHDYERIHELSLRTNQFNLYPQALTGIELHQAIKQGVPKVLKIEVTDQFMNYGLVGVLIYESSTDAIEVKSLFLSCRILSRGIEHEVVNHLLRTGTQLNVQSVAFEFIRTDRNTPALNFLRQLNKQRELEGQRIVLPIQSLKEYSPLIEEEGHKPQKKSSKAQKNPISHDYMLEIADVCVAHQNKILNSTESHKKTNYDSIKTHLHELFLSHHINIDQNDIPFTYFGLTSLQSVLISSELYTAYHVEINPVDLIHRSITMDDLFSQIMEKLRHTQDAPVSASPNDIEESPMSHAQKRLWYDEQINENNSSRNTMFIAFQLKGQINKEALSQTFTSLIKKHDSLRFSFIEQEEPYIHITAPDKLLFEVEYVLCDSIQEISTSVSDFKNHYFDLSKAPLFRVVVINPESHTPLLLFCIHHIIHDGWSLNILLKEITLYYGLYSVNNQISSIPQYTTQHRYIDYISRESMFITEALLQKNKLFWSKYLHKLPKLELVFDFPAKELEQTSKCSRIPFKLDKMTSKLLKKWALTYHVTLYELLSSAFGLFLSQLCNQNDIHFITAVSGRHQPQSSDTIGFFVNLLLLRFHIDRSKSFIELVKEQKKVISTVMVHQDLSFHDVLHQVGESIGSKHTFFHQAGFVYQNYPIYNLELNGAMGQRIGASDDASLLYDACDECRFGNLVCFMQEFDGQLHGLFEYNSNLFSKEMIGHYIDSFQTLLKHSATNPLCIASDIPLISEHQKTLLLYRWNQEISPYESPINLLTQFSKSVTQYPDKIAIRIHQNTCTYLELDQKSNLLARQLLEKGVMNETPVALYMEQGIQQITAMLAILKAGGCYLPLDTDIPYQRMNYILNDSGVSIILVDQHTRKHLTSFAVQHLNILDVSLPMVNSERELSSMPVIEMKPNHLAYIMYTSGSTGTPKGVLIEHAGIIRLVQSTNYIVIKAHDRIAQSSKFLFDASTLEIWGALLNGATLVCLPQDTLLDKDALHSILKEERITILFLTTQLFHTYAHLAPELFSQLKYLVIGGEALLADSVIHLFDQPKHPRCVINGYGPTENTTFSTTYLIKNKKHITNPIPIGKPISGTKVYVLNKELNLASIGAIGTLFLSGHGLSREYLNQDSLTLKRFIHLFGERLYNTGDLVVWQPDGNLRYLGREDNQIKINGYRIELNEIEAQLITHPLIEQAIVLPKYKEHQRYIAAYILLKETGDLIEINLYHHLKQTLPQYMMPHFFYQLDYIPMTSNGKVDKKQLEQLHLEPVSYIEFELPNNYIEEQLASIYARTLRSAQDKISINSEFFDIGGTSISALQLIHTINNELKLNLTFSILYEKASIKDLSRYIETLIHTPHQAQQTLPTGANIGVLKQIKKGSDTKIPLILVHPIGGTGFCYMELIKLLPDNQPCYLIQDPSIDANCVLFDDMRSMATHYNKILLNYFGNTTFLLGGYSFGGMLSIEMANQLGHLEHLIAGIVAFDTWIVSHLLNERAKEALKQSIISQYEQIEENLRKEHINPKPWMELYYIRLQDLGFSYIPPRVNTKIILFKAKQLEKEFAAMCDASNFLQLHSNQKIDVHLVEGNHNTILQLPHVHLIASILSHHPILGSKK